MLSQNQIRDFQEVIWDYYRAQGRNLPWRNIGDDYKIYVSEIMLQQTQVDRVKPKYESFLRQFPDFAALGAAPLSEIIREWSGLGYNRRAKFLKQAAAIITDDYAGKVPNTPESLIKLPGIGAGTVGSLLAFVHNQPHPFIETNIRRVFIYHFFADQDKVNDSEILPLVVATIDRENPREWYYALMDYGTHLAKEVTNPNRASKHYAKQSRFIGSLRQGRGIVLRELSAHAHRRQSLITLLSREHFSEIQIDTILQALIKEKLIQYSQGYYALVE